MARYERATTKETSNLKKQINLLRGVFRQSAHAKQDSNCGEGVEDGRRVGVGVTRPRSGVAVGGGQRRTVVYLSLSLSLSLSFLLSLPVWIFVT